MGTDDEDAKKKEIEDEIHRLDEQKAKKQQQIAAANRAEKLAKGLKALLEDKYPGGKYKRDTVEKALKIAKQWLSKSKELELSEEEKRDLLTTLERLKSNPSNEDKKLWSNPQDKRWENIKALLGNEWTKKLLSGND